MRTPRKDGTDERLTGGIEQHGMAGLPDTDFFDHRKEGIESVGRLDGADDRMLVVVQDGDRDIDGFFRRAEGSFLPGDQPADIDPV